MASAASLFSFLHLVALAVFVGGTSVLMLVAILTRLRIRRPLLVWRIGPLTRVPLGPSLFLLVVLAGLGYASATGQDVPLSVWIGYPAGGVFWFVATWLVQSVLITEYGLVPNLLSLPDAVAWSQIVDYFTTVRDGRRHFVFFYRDRDHQERRRLNLPVPEGYVDDVRNIVRAKLDARFPGSERTFIDEEVVWRGGGPFDPR